jgi:hypothetical protein
MEYAMSKEADYSTVVECGVPEPFRNNAHHLKFSIIVGYHFGDRVQINLFELPKLQNDSDNSKTPGTYMTLTPKRRVNIKFEI